MIGCQRQNPKWHDYLSACRLFFFILHALNVNEQKKHLQKEIKMYSEEMIGIDQRYCYMQVKGIIMN